MHELTRRFREIDHFLLFEILIYLQRFATIEIQTQIPPVKKIYDSRKFYFQISDTF